ncbi:MAG: hypothetical protein EOP04_33150 [Proteobacteria bacterium]|nr:MAG: hypothetical protein EOP04_33150 [Pseudomonadota bacterium]
MIQRDGELSILIEDNGIGIGKGKDAEGKGMKLIAARVNSYAGELNIESNPNSGTVVMIAIPFESALETVLN